MNEHNVIAKEAIEFAKKHKKEIACRLTDILLYPPDPIPISVFMAGSPGAGKTEFSRNLVDQFTTPQRKVICVDPDQLRSELPGYIGKNSFLFQGAVSIITDRILDQVFHQNQSFILDGTFSHYGPAYKNIIRSLEHSRQVFIFFVYQHPGTAWEITKNRERIEGRQIPKEAFVDEFFAAQETVMKLKAEFKEKLSLCFVDKETSKDTTQVYMQIDSIYQHLPERFTKEQFYSILKTYEISS
ncbi:MAG: zeta toxin family protein [Ferruginibacter sp.]